MSRGIYHPRDSYTPASTGIRRLPWVREPTWWPRREHHAARPRLYAAYARLREIQQATQHEWLWSFAGRKAADAAYLLRVEGVRGDVSRILLRDAETAKARGAS